MCGVGASFLFLLFSLCVLLCGGVCVCLASVPSRLPPDDRDRASGAGEFRTGLMPSFSGGGKADGCRITSNRSRELGDGTL